MSGAPPPGRSTSQRQARRGIVIMLVVAMVAAAYGVLDYLYLTPGDPENLLIIVGVFSLPLVILAYVVFLWRLRSAKHLMVRASPARVTPGESIEVTLEILDIGKVGDRLELGLECVRGTQVTTGESTGVSEELLHEEWRDVSRTETPQRHRFTLPPDAASSFHHGPRSYLFWRVSAREPRGWRFDRRAEHELAVDAASSPAHVTSPLHEP